MPQKNSGLQTWPGHSDLIQGVGQDWGTGGGRPDWALGTFWEEGHTRGVPQILRGILGRRGVQGAYLGILVLK